MAQRFDASHALDDHFDVDAVQRAPGKRTLTARLPCKPGGAPQPVEDGASGSTSSYDLSCDQSFVDSVVNGPVQRRADGASEHDAASVHEIAAAGVAGDGGRLPYFDQIQASFGAHDVGGIQAHTGAAASAAAGAIGASAYATGDHVAFAGAPDLHTAAHEAAHVVQQRAGVHLKGGVGEEGDAYEQHADAVADAVVRGESAEHLLGAVGGGAVAAGGVQRKGWTQKGKGRVGMLDGKSVMGGVFMSHYPNDVVEPDQKQQAILKSLALDLKKALGRGEKHMLQIEGWAAGTEKAPKGEARAKAAAAYLRTQGIPDQAILDIAGKGRGNDDDEGANRKVVVHVTSVGSFTGRHGGGDADHPDPGRVGRDAPEPSPDDPTMTKIDIGQTIVTQIIDGLVFDIAGPIWGGFSAWYGAIDAIQGLTRSMERLAYRDGVIGGSGACLNKTLSGAERVTYDQAWAGFTKDWGRYVPAQRGEVEDDMSRGTLSVAGTSKYDGVWNDTMDSVEHHTKLAIYKYLHQQHPGQKIQDDRVAAIYGKIIHEVRKAAAKKLHCRIEDAIKKKLK